MAQHIVGNCPERRGFVLTPLTFLPKIKFIENQLRPHMMKASWKLSVFMAAQACWIAASFARYMISYIIK